MDEPISAGYRLIESDYLDVVVAQQRYLMTNPIFRVAKWLLVGLSVLAPIVVLISALINPRLGADEQRRSFLIAMTCVALLWPLVYLTRSRNILNRIACGQKFRAIPEGSLRIEWGCDPEGLWSRSALAEGSYRWEMFRTIVETRECFLFYQGENFALWLPGHAFANPDDVRRFAELARSRVAHYVVLGECQFPAKPEPAGRDEL